MQETKIEYTLEYQLKYDKFGNERKYKLPAKRVTKLREFNSWLENDLKNQWIYKDYRCYYIVISMFNKGEYTVSCSGSTIDHIFNDLETAKMESFKYIDKLSK